MTDLNVVESFCIGEVYDELTDEEKSNQTQLYNIISSNYERCVEDICDTLEINIVPYGEMKDIDDDVMDYETYINKYVSSVIYNKIMDMKNNLSN